MIELKETVSAYQWAVWAYIGIATIFKIIFETCSWSITLSIAESLASKGSTSSSVRYSDVLLGGRLRRQHDAYGILRKNWLKKLLLCVGIMPSRNVLVAGGYIRSTHGCLLIRAASGMVLLKSVAINLVFRTKCPRIVNLFLDD